MFKFFRPKHLNFGRIYNKTGKIFHRSRSKRGRYFKKWIVLLSKGSGIAVFIIFLLFVVYFLIGIIGLKTAYEISFAGSNYLQSAGENLTAGNYSQAKIEAILAKRKFDEARLKLKTRKKNVIWQYSPMRKENLENLDHFFSAAQLSSQTLVNLSEIGNNFEHAVAAMFDGHAIKDRDKENVLGTIFQNQPELIGSRANLNLATVLLARINRGGVMSIFRDEIIRLGTEVDKTNKLISNVAPLAELIPQIFGYPGRSSYLVLFQNENKIWPTGGVITAYGKMDIEKGKITEFKTYSAQELDSLTAGKVSIIPPEQLGELTAAKEWFLAETNWSVNWPTAAKQIVDIARWRNDALGPSHPNYIDFKEPLTGVITINQSVLSDWIMDSGPVEVAGRVYYEEDISELFSSSDERSKEVLGPIVKVLYSDAMAGSASELLLSMKMLYNHLAQKDMQLSYVDEEYNRILDKYRLYDKISEADGDFLLVVNTNLSDTTGDGEISRAINYSLKQDVNGLFARTGLSYSYEGEFEPKKEKYKVYTKLLVPQDSILLSADGVKMDDIIESREFGKTAFSCYHELSPGAITNISFHYKLPARIEEQIKNGQYKLYLEKQAGSKVDHSRINLAFQRPIISYSPIGFFVDHDNNKIKWESDLKTDKVFSMRFN